MKITLPTTVIYTERNHHFFAKIEWELHKRFGKSALFLAVALKKINI